MLFEWNDEKIEWYVRASRATGFHSRLADMIRPALRGTDCVADFGCGPGLIDMEIAQDVKCIEALDVDPIVLSHYKREIKDGGFSNIRTILGDVKENFDAVAPDCFDVSLLCFFGGPSDVFEKARRNATRLAIHIMHGNGGHARQSKIGGDFKRVFADEMDEYLNDKKISYTKINEELDFGQPFLSLAEARQYFELYANEGEDEPSGRKAQIERKLSLVQETDDPDYPYFFPYMKAVSVYLIEK